jgi:hypothetical protein
VKQGVEGGTVERPISPPRRRDGLIVKISSKVLFINPDYVKISGFLDVRRMTRQGGPATSA